VSTKSKLLAMTGDLQLPAAAAAPAAAPAQEALPPAAPAGAEGPKFPPVVPGVAARTGPGQMLQFRGQMLAVEGELAKLRDRLKEHEGAAPTRKLDARLINPSRWANRHKDAFATPEFLRLKQDIELAGGNVQPILVRMLAGQADRYEIVFGHRRHRACAELGLPVLATIEPGTLSDLDLFSAMDRENRERADLSPFEQGAMYRRALDEGLYPSNRRLAEALGVSHTWVANVLLVADLPPAVLECFRSPLEVQHRHARLITSALDRDRKAVLRRAEKLRQQGRRLAPAAVVETLVATSDEPDMAKPQLLQAGGKVVGSWFKDRAGRLTIQLEPGVAVDGQLDAAVLAVLRTLTA